MTQTAAFRNVVGRVYAGYDPHVDVPICDEPGGTRGIEYLPNHTDGKSYQTEDGCGEKLSLSNALTGLCMFNHIALR